MSIPNECLSHDEVLAKLYERYDLAMKRIRQSPEPTKARIYWSGEANALQGAIEYLGGTVNGR